ncbi:hypothetical protein LCM10_04010 [Rossellomorea aquimaris]|uniref:hypothetical protein n=1 Tax=Rossellomorea aquimaris TaxID=189382 RepID=UPI001CD7BF74|nr:hypothetical protein [Rossellomorea aquimaris]MCA1054141.1 hypothetical protein [Rossellomorea aquimaris]
MEKQIIEMLFDIQRNMKEFGSELKETRADVRGIRIDLDETRADVKQLSQDLSNTQSDVKDIKETVNRIEASQTEDVIALLKMNKQNSKTDFDYLNTRITNVDKRVFNLENRVED